MGVKEWKIKRMKIYFANIPDFHHSIIPSFRRLT